MTVALLQWLSNKKAILGTFTGVIVSLKSNMCFLLMHLESEK